MWQFLSLIVSFGSPFALLRRARERLNGESSGGRVRAWTTRNSETAHFSRADALQVDIWGSNRGYLSLDAWKEQREKLGREPVKSGVRGDPERRMFLLEELDGGETLDGAGRRRKASRNARARDLVTEEEVRRMFR